MFYPEAEPSRCTLAVLLEVDPVGLVRGRRGPAGEGGLLEQYVNDRPYAVNSFMSVALGRLFATALGGKSKERQDLANTPIPLTANLPVIAARGGEDLVRRLFEPLGYSTVLSRLPLDESFPAWGESPNVSLELSASVTLQTFADAPLCADPGGYRGAGFHGPHVPQSVGLLEKEHIPCLERRPS